MTTKIQYTYIDLLPKEAQKNTLYDPNYTYHYDKYSCIRDMYFAHVFFSYMVMLTGLGCFFTRIVPARYKWMHAWFGRGYILSMIWAMATSLLIHNTGLPAAVLISFLWVLAGLTIGWIVISIHTINLTKQAVQAVQEDIKAHGLASGSLEEQINAKKGRIIAERTMFQRFFSWKTLHACLMFTSWINITGRIFASNQSGDFTCHTYPVYKPIDGPVFSGAGYNLTLVPITDPKFTRLPWAKSGLGGWAVMLSVIPMLGTAGIAFVYSYFASKNAASVRASHQDNAEGLPIQKSQSMESGQGQRYMTGPEGAYPAMIPNLQQAMPTASAMMYTGQMMPIR